MRSILVALLLCLAMGSASFADDGDHRQRVVMPVGDWPPFRFVSEEQMHGMDFDLMEEVARRMSLKIEYHRTPWNRSLTHMQQGKVDAMTGLARRPEREAYIYYVEPPYSFCSTVFYTAAGKGDTIRSYEDLYGKRLGYVLGSAYFPRFDGDDSLPKLGVGTEDQLLKMALAGRLDVFIGTDCQVDSELVLRGMSDKIDKATYAPGNKVALYLGVSRYSVFFNSINELERVMRDMKRDGTFKRINNEYFSAKPRRGRTSVKIPAQ